MVKSKIIFLLILAHIVVYSLFSKELIIIDGETMVHRITNNSAGSNYKTVTTYLVSELNGEVVYSYHNQDEFYSWDVCTDRNALPRSIVFSTNGNEMELFFDNGRVHLTGTWEGEIINESVDFNDTVTLENDLVARTLDLNSMKKHVFSLLQTNNFPQLKSFQMYFKVLGEETVNVPAGTFNCKKVCFSFDGVSGLFYKAYYYISDDEHHYIVKIENMPMKCTTELEKILTLHEVD